MNVHPEKLILDACCGGRSCWNDKNNPFVLFADIRVAEPGHISLRPNHEVRPDVIVDFREMPFENETFSLILFDPPHIFKRNNDGLIAKKYGHLNRDTWKDDIKKGFAECWRVLRDGGILVFKWSETEVKLKEVRTLFPAPPLFGHQTTNKGTFWMCFMKQQGGEGE